MAMHPETEHVAAHIEKHVGKIHMVFHEIVSDDLHIDIHHVKSTLLRRYEVLVTSGMSAIPMNLPADVQQPRRAEIVTVLPKGWPLTTEAFQDENHYWPLRLMKDLARLPHYGKTWIGFGHTIANADDGAAATPVPKQYAPDTSLCAAAVLPPFTLPEKAWSFHRPDGDEVFLWAAVPLHRAELDYKMQHGMDPLLDLFDKHGVTDRIDPARKSVV